MRARRIVVLGDAMLDVYLSGDAEHISPEAPVPVVAIRSQRYAPGGAANVAANVAALGAECRLVTVVGDDPRSDALHAELSKKGLNHHYTVVAAGRPTTSKTRVTARGQQLVRIDEEVDDPIPPRIEEQVAAQLQRAMADADALLIEDYNKGTLTPAVIELAMKLGKARGVPVVVDPKFKNFFAYCGATVFKPNRQELEHATGPTLDLSEDHALPSARERLRVENLLLTLGSEGMVLVTKDSNIVRIPAMAREVFDVSGAGDTVTAWTGVALAAGASVLQAAQVANYAASVEVGKSGVATVSPDEVLAAHDAR
jgi:D-beta-D-heptose 7-phosphate kinase/D-beta-D-heptose 1-phosphate adenosyltransferase